MPVYMAIGHNVQVYLSQNDARRRGRVPLANYAPSLNYLVRLRLEVEAEHPELFAALLGDHIHAPWR